MKKQIKMILSEISPTFVTYLSYYYNFHEVLDLRNPKGINQKLQYLKLKTYNNNSTVAKCVDKLCVRQYLKEKGYEKLSAKLLGGYCTVEEFRKDWGKFPNQFVAKCNHGCGYNILVTDKESFSLDMVAVQLEQWLKEDYWKIYCEPQYRYVEKKILVEEYLPGDIETYKFYCFHGKPKILYISKSGEHGEADLYVDYYDMNLNWLPITLDQHLHSKEHVRKPEKYEEMVQIAENLSKEFPFVRVDLYDVGGKIYFSELTFIPTGGMMKLHPDNLIEKWGEWIEI